jgi:hypothetical protein
MQRHGAYGTASNRGTAELSSVDTARKSDKAFFLSITSDHFSLHRYQHSGLKIFSKTPLHGSLNPAFCLLCVSYFCAQALVDPILKTIMAGIVYPVSLIVFFRNSRRELDVSFWGFIVITSVVRKLLQVFALRPADQVNACAASPQCASANSENSARERIKSLVFSL